MTVIRHPKTYVPVKDTCNHRKDNYVSHDNVRGLEAISPSGSKAVDRIVAMPDAQGAFNDDTASRTGERNLSLSVEDMLEMPSLTSFHCDSHSLMQWDNSTHNASFSSHRSSSVHPHDWYPIQSSMLREGQNDVTDVPGSISALVRWNLHPNETSTFATAKSRLILVESRNYQRGATAGRPLEELSPVLTMRKEPKSRNAVTAKDSTELDSSLHLHIVCEHPEDTCNDGRRSSRLNDTKEGIKSLADDSSIYNETQLKGKEDEPKHRIRTNYSTPSRAHSFERFIPDLSSFGDSAANKQDVVPSPPQRQDSLQDIEDRP
jgi:hypothetical protein